MKFFTFFFKKKFSTSKPTEIKVINSHIKLPIEESKLANEKRIKEIKEYQKEMAKTRKLHAQFAQKFPTKAEKEKEEQAGRAERKEATWTKYVEGLKKSLNPPIKELQESGKIRKVDLERKTAKAEQGQLNLQKSLKQTILMRRKYVNYLSTEVLPYLVTKDNLEAKICEAVDGAIVSSHNLTAEMVVEREKEVKRKLKEIRVPMEEYENKIHEGIREEA